MVDIWYTEKVIKGTGNGKKLGFPTINLNAKRFVNELESGIYSCLVDYKNKVYLGALYFGPRYSNKNLEYILEIHIIDFKKNIYNKNVEFKIGEFIRKPVKTKSKEELRNLIENDVQKIKSL